MLTFQLIPDVSKGRIAFFTCWGVREVHFSRTPQPLALKAVPLLSFLETSGTNSSASLNNNPEDHNPPADDPWSNVLSNEQPFWKYSVEYGGSCLKSNPNQKSRCLSQESNKKLTPIVPMTNDVWRAKLTRYLQLQRSANTVPVDLQDWIQYLHIILGCLTHHRSDLRHHPTRTCSTAATCYGTHAIYNYCPNFDVSEHKLLLIQQHQWIP